MKSKVIITGLTGMLNDYIFNEFKKKYKVFFFHHRNIKSKKKFIYIKYSDKKKVREYIEKINPVCLIHAAGITNVDVCENNKKKNFEVNFKITKKLVDECKRKNFFMIYISTDHLFDGKNISGYSEKSKPNPINQYAKCKALSEKYIKTNLDNYLIIRTNFFGKGNKFKNSFSDKIIDKLKKRKEIFLFDDVFFNPISMNVLSKVILQLYKNKKTGIFNIATDKRISKYEFGKKVAKYKKYRVSLIKKNSIENVKITKRPKNMFLINKKIKKVVKFNSKIENNLRYI